jgi:hypothetical protein
MTGPTATCRNFDEPGGPRDRTPGEKVVQTDLRPDDHAPRHAGKVESLIQSY